MDKTIKIYTLTEVLSLVNAFEDFITQWKTLAPNLRDAGATIEARYGDWCCLYVVDGLTDAETKAKAINLYAKMTAWVKQYGPHWSELAGIEATNTSTSTARFNDTPETAGDYSSLEHTSNITVSEGTTSSFAERYDKAREDLTSDAIHAFRKAFLTREDLDDED